MASSPTQPLDRCPVCWLSVRPGARRCPSCKSDLTAARAPEPTSASDSASRGRLVPQARAEQGRRSRGRWVTVAVAAFALVTAVTIKVVGSRLPPPAEAGAATGNTGARIAVTAQTAVHALEIFQPAGDVETVGTALAFATRDRAHLPPSARFSVRPGPDASQIVTVKVPVNVAFLQKVHAIQTGFGPNLSNVAKGSLYINAADDNAYGIVMDPRTRIATFAFRLSKRDGTIWSLNLNAMQVVSQTQSLG